MRWGGGGVAHAPNGKSRQPPHGGINIQRTASAGIPFLTPRIHIHIYLSPERTGDSLIELIRYWILWKWQCHSAGTILGSRLKKIPKYERGCQNFSMHLTT
jgi:hypothetical protein